MKFGAYFAYWEPEWTADYEAYCKKAAGLGFDILEIAANSLPGMSRERLVSLKQAAAAAGITLTACIGLPAQYDVASPEPSVRAAGLDFLNRIFSAMEIAEIGLLGGIVYACWPYDYSVPFQKEKARERSLQSVRAAAASAEVCGITLMLEVVNRFEHFLLNSAAEGLDFVREADRANVRLLLDTFHMNIEEDDIPTAIRSTGACLGHLHIGECNRKVPGKGRMPWMEIGEALTDTGYNGGVVMEPFVRPGGTVGKDIKVWRDLSGKADNAGLDSDIAEALRFVRHAFGAH